MNSRVSSLRRRLDPTLLATLLSLLAFAAPRLARAQEPDAFTAALEHGPLSAGLAAFVGGLLTCLTPCVYPMIAITVSVFGAKQAKSRRQAAMLSTSFVLGMAVLFTTILVGAALTGSVFGSALSNRWVLAALAAIFIALAASLFGAFEMTLPDSLMQRLSSVGGVGYGGSFLLGLVTGLVAAPCTGPVLTGMLVWIGKTQSVLLGTAAGLAFAIGLGLPFWLVGTFAVALPKGGKWMMSIKSFFGIVMLVVALHFLRPAIPALESFAQPGSSFLAVMAGIIVAGLVLGAVHLSWDDGGALVKARKGAGIAITTVGAFMLWVGFTMAEPVANAAGGAEALTWNASEEQGIAQAKAEGKPVLIDFTAEWCMACKELAKDTFADPRVAAEAKRFVAIRVDATDDEDEQIDKIKGKYKVVGLPTVVLLDAQGVERKRFNQFVAPDAFLAAIKTVQ